MPWMSMEQRRRMCLAVGNLVRAAAAWGSAKEAKEDTERFEQMIHQFARDCLTEAFERDPDAQEIDWVWEM